MTTLAIEIIQKASALTPSEQIEIAMRLLQQAHDQVGLSAQRYSWLAIGGTAPYPLAGEDAQDWVSRSREADDRARLIQWAERK